MPCALSRRHQHEWPQRIRFRCEQPGIDPIFATGYFFIDLDGSIRGETRGFRPGEDVDFEELSLTADAAAVEQAVSLTPLVKRTGLHPRLPDGSAVESMAFSWETMIEEDVGPADEFPVYADNGRLVVTLVRDFAPVEVAIAELERDAQNARLDLFSDLPFRRRAVMGGLLLRLGVSDALPCCPVEENLPATLVENPLLDVVSEAGEADTAATARQAFGAYCAACHSGSEPFPPNFLRGESDLVGNAIAHCAQRIAYRLAMWHLAEEERSKTPMPPLSFLQSAGSSAQDWRRSESFAALGRNLSALLALTGSSAIRVESRGGQAYEDLPPCLADVDQQQSIQYEITP